MLAMLTEVIVNMLETSSAIARVPRMFHARTKISRINPLGVLG
jgi:hypothetical protein